MENDVKNKYHDILRHISSICKKLQLTETYLRGKLNEIEEIEKELVGILQELYEIYDIENPE